MISRKLLMDPGLYLLASVAIIALYANSGPYGQAAALGLGAVATLAYGWHTERQIMAFLRRHFPEEAPKNPPPADLEAHHEQDAEAGNRHQ